MKSSTAFLAFVILGLVGNLMGADSPEQPASELEPEDVLVPLRFGSVSIFTENDKYFAGTDRNYTNGFKLSFLSRDLRSIESTKIPSPARVVSDRVGMILDRKAHAKIGFSLGQNIYTPTDTATTEYQPDDRPYAAWLYLGAAFQTYRSEVTRGNGQMSVPARLDVFEINLGVVGPAALGRQVQNGFHDIINVDHAQGWKNQIHNEPGVNLIYERRWRFSTREARRSWGLDLMPHVGVSLGNIFTYANAGAELRLGYALPADFGTNLIRPSGDSNSARPRFSVFMFMGLDGRAVARDITLDGNTFRESPSIDKKSFVYDVMGGVGVGWSWMQVTYTQARRSLEFRGQGEPQDFGSISASIFF